MRQLLFFACLLCLVYASVSTTEEVVLVTDEINPIAATIDDIEIGYFKIIHFF